MTSPLVPSRVFVVWMLCVLGIGTLASTRALTQGRQGGGRPAAAAWPPRLEGPAAGELQVLPVQGQIHMIVGAGANITVQAGESGVMVVDTGTAAMSDKVIAAIRSISKRPLRYIVNTVEWPEYSGGNAKIAPTGEIIPFREPNYTAGPQGALDIKKASVISYLTVFHRMSEAGGPENAWPDNTYSTEQKRLSFNDEPVVMLHQVANTDGNSIVHFRKSDVISVGPMLDLESYPRIDVKAGGSIQSMVEGLNRLIELAVPEANAAGGTMIVPGHGRIADHAEVAYYRDMITIIRDRIQDGIKKNMTLAQIKTARPTRDYDARYGKTAGPWTTDMFVEAAYASLMKK
jgi:cyclase